MGGKPVKPTVGVGVADKMIVGSLVNCTVAGVWVLIGEAVGIGVLVDFGVGVIVIPAIAVAGGLIVGSLMVTVAEG